MTDPLRTPARRRHLLVAAGVLVLVAGAAAALVVQRSDRDQPAPGLTVGWGGSEGIPSCVHFPDRHEVAAKVTIVGTVRRHTDVTVTVTAYADENTSRPVGSGTRSVQVEGTVDLPLLVTFPVTRAPHVDVDAETACSLSVSY